MSRQSYICCKELISQWDYWQLVTAIQDEGHGLILRERHPHGDDCYLSLSVCFGLTGINIMDTFNMYLWIFLCNLIHTYYSSAFAGDVHCGGHSDILRNHKILFRQLTTSAIANMPLPKSAYYFMRAAGKLGRLQKDFCFRHHHWTRARNYGVVQIKHRSREVTSSLLSSVFTRKPWPLSVWAEWGCGSEEEGVLVNWRLGIPKTTTV